ncbi:heme peroxidase [Entophlyctis luteolus]|nr:heme peroxidase [Entophlyctis luteolus]
MLLRRAVSSFRAAACARAAPVFPGRATAAKRTFASSSSSSSSSSWTLPLLIGVAGAGGYYFLDDIKAAVSGGAVPFSASSKPLDYQEVYNAIAGILDNDNYDDGSYGPVLVRLAWHASGTYDKNTKTGGSNGATMRFDPEASHGANAGLAVARSVLEPIKKKFPQITYADLWTLAGVVAVQEMGGPLVPWRPGRADAVSGESCPPEGRLPDASQGQKHIRDIFYKMGFNDQEIVALAGAHALGRCHKDRSGYDGPWTRAPTTFSNDYFKRLLEEKWVERKWTGPKQFADKATGDLMMLPGDMAFYNDRTFYLQSYKYAKDSDLFFKDFSAAFSKLLELGVPFPEDSKPLLLKPTNATNSALIVHSLILAFKVKPDGVQRGLVGEIIKRFESKGFKLAGLKLVSPGKAHLEQHYADLAGKKFFPGLISYMTSGPVVAMVWVGKGVVKAGRVLLGETNPLASLPGTIRGDFAVDIGRNICHGSDSVESAEK